ncbi:MAG: energy transducer TonB [Pyrinomonadaceae bacterium]|nr:energy transducer TonB [Pyrinomonadaceae bacterium]
MKKEFRGLCVITLMALVGSNGISTLAQQRQPEQTPQSEAKRVLIERERTMQESRPATPAPGQDYFERELIMPVPAPGDFTFLATEMSFGGLLVKGAPYSAQAVTESTQTLTDGNRIINKWTASVYRDSEGRTRREQTLRAIGPLANGGEPAQTIFISDPVAGTSYTLDPRTQTARKMPPLRVKVLGSKSLDPQVSPPAVFPMGVEGLSAKQDGKQYRIAIGSDAMTDKRQLEAGIAMGWLDARNPSAHSEALGKQNIEGVQAEGTRTTVTIPAGKIGNELPISIVAERWYSPELQIIVMTRHTDPRFGENSYKLINISRNEPARELFEVPTGYTVTEAHTPVAGTGPGIGIGTGTGTGSAPITGGMLNGKAINLPVPVYPEIARQANASGTVTVQITIDEEGNVISANAVSGHPLLRAAAVTAARAAKFSPTKLSGQAVKVTGVLAYTFGQQ